MDLQRGKCRLPKLLGKMTPAEFARSMKVSESTVSRWINGKRIMSYDHAIRASHILKCHPKDLYNWIEPANVIR